MDLHRHLFLETLVCLFLLQSVFCRPHHHRELCRVRNIPVQRNLDLNKFVGKWYDVARTKLQGEGRFIKSGVGLFTKTDTLQYVYSGKEKSSCLTSMIATGYETNVPGKMFLAFDPDINSFLRGNFWVVSTDYTSYALIYGCNQLRVDGHCHHRHQLVYLLSRTPQLPASILLSAEKLIQDVLCVDINQLTLSIHEEDCLQEENYLDFMFGDEPTQDPPTETEEAEEVTCQELTDCDTNALGCAHGLKQDENGCDTCACHVCHPVLCRMRCEHGYVQDERHCDICQCVDPPNTMGEPESSEENNDVGGSENPGENRQQIVDANAVVPEFLFDIQELSNEETPQEPQQNDEQEDGENEVDHEIDEAIGVVSQCPAIMCAMACAHGFVQDENGCDLCQCFQCAVPMCANQCEHGYMVSDKGCDTCDCAPASAAYQHEPAACRPLQCHVTCPSGFKKDEHGCEMCRCEGCPDVTCLLYCANGYKQNEGGCQYCQCNEGENRQAEDACIVADIEALEHIDFERLAGNWRKLAIASNITNSIKTARLERVENGMDLLYKSVWEDDCGPTKRGSWRKLGSRDGDIYTEYGPKSGALKMLHITADYNYLIQYLCLHTRPDGTCGVQAISIWGRNGEFPEEVKEELVSKVPRACAKPDDFVHISHGAYDCPIRPSDEPVESCKLSDLQAQKRVDWSGFEGRWYSVAKLYSRDVDQSGEYRVVPTRDGKLSLKYRGSRNGICGDISEAHVSPNNDGSEAFTIRIGNVRAEGMLIYHDNNMALYYECGEITNSGECKKGAEYVEVMYREKHVPGYLNQAFGRMLEDFCIDVNDLVPIEHEVSCPVREICTMSNIPTQDNFNATAFSGMWHSVARLRRSDGWDHVTAQASSAPDHQIILHFTGAKDGQCQASSTAVLSPMHPEHLADFMLYAGRRTAFVKIIYTNYEVAVIYECQTMGVNDKCVKGQEFLDVLSRHPDGFTGTDLHSLHEHLESACASEEDMQLSTHQAECPLTPSAAGCVLSNLPLQEDFQVEMVTGRWFVALSDFTAAQTLKPSMREVTLLPDGHLLDAVISQRDGQCVHPRVLIGKSDSGWSEASYNLIKGKFVKPDIKVAYADNDTLITYFCKEEDEHGMCVPGQMSVFVSTRQQNISDSKREAILPVVGQLCVDTERLVTYDNSIVCDLNIPPQMCKVEDTPILKKFDIKQAMGKWYVMYRTKGTASPDGLVLELLPGKDDHIVARYTGLRRRYCMEPLEFELIQQHEPEEAQLFIKYDDNVNGVVRVVFTDYSHMMLYECGLITADGSCAAGQASVEILGRTTEPLESMLEYALMKRLSELCIEREDMELVPHEVSCENFTDDCENRPIPSMDNLNLTAFVGTWYSFARLQHSSPWNSGAVNFTINEEGRMIAKLISSRQGTCLQTSEMEMIPGNKTSEWSHAGNPSAFGRVVHTDYINVAIVFDCTHGNEDGTCPQEHRHVEVLTRDFERPREGTKRQMLPVGLQLCVRKRDFRRTAKPVRCDFVEEQRQCNVEQFHLEEDFNPYTLLGEWFSYARKKSDGAIDSSKYLITRADSYGSKLRMFYTGMRNGQCSTGGQTQMEARTDEPNKFTLKYTEDGQKETGELTVLFADDQHALIHECYHVKSDGSCNKDDTYVEIITRRHKSLYPEARQKIVDALYRACFTLEDLMLSVHEVNCAIPIPGRRCEFDRTLTHPDFDYRSIMGKTWFTRARVVPGASPIWSGVGLVTFSHVDTNKVQIAWGAINPGDNGTEKCFSGTNIMERRHSDADFLELYKGSFVYTKVLFADDNLLVTYDCMLPEFRENIEQCPLNSSEIGMHHRIRATPMPQVAVNFIKDIVRTQTCLDPEAVEILDVPEPCAAPPKEKLGRLCFEDSITAMEDLDLTKISGLWFQVARAHAAKDIHWDAGVFHLSIEDPNRIRIQFTGRSSYSENSCMPVYTVDAYPDPRQPAYMVYNSQRFRNKKGLMKIIYVDDDVLIIFECLPGGHQSNGLCKRDKEHVEIYARRTHINSQTFRTVNRVLHEKTCFTDHDLVMSNRTAGCVLPDHDHHHYKASSCEVSSYPAVEHIDYKAFSGLWYEVERSQYHDAATHWSNTAGHRGKLWEAAVLYYEPVRDDVFNYSHTGYTPRDGQCQGPFIAHTHPIPGKPKHSGHMHFFPGHTQAHGGPWAIRGTHKVVWTDYEEAVIYICFSEKDDGTCRHDTEFVSIISRNTHIPEAKLDEIHNIIKDNLCVHTSAFVRPHSDYEKCLGVLGFEHVEEYSGEEVGLKVCKTKHCERKCPQGYTTDELGCHTCQCVKQETDDGSGSGSVEMVELGSGAVHITNVEEDLLNEVEELSSLIGH